MAKIRSFGAEVYINGFAIGGLTDISASGTEVSTVDTTSHDTAGGFKTFLAGLMDGGTLELTGKYNYADDGQAEWKGEEGVSHAFYIILSDNSGFAFTAIVGGFQTSNPLDDAVEFTATAKITGPVYPVFPIMTVTGTLTSNGSTPVTFPTLYYAGIYDGRPSYTDDASIVLSGTNTHVAAFDLPAADNWTLLQRSPAAAWISIDLELTVNEAGSWTPSGAATGTPVITGS